MQNNLTFQNFSHHTTISSECSGALLTGKKVLQCNLKALFKNKQMNSKDTGMISSAHKC